MGVTHRTREIIHAVTDRELIIRPQGPYARVETNALRAVEVELIREALADAGLDTYSVTKDGHTEAIFVEN